ncbi:MAG: DoxX family protein [Deltaproteobacteria bacterium]|nr:DoxX family protein [Deltaproteobacteria bacterium]
MLGNTSFGLSSRFPIARWAPIPLRLIVGYGFMEHGFAKLSNGVDTFAAILGAIGVPDPHLMARLTILTELFGGLAVILGAFVPIVSLPMAAVLLTAMFTVHLPYGFSSIKLIAVTAAGPKFGPPGYEVALLYIACLAALVIGGSGPFAVDGLIEHALSNYLRRSKFVALRDDRVIGDVGCGKGARSASEIRGRSLQ